MFRTHSKMYHRDLLVSFAKASQPQTYLELGVGTGDIFSEIAKVTEEAIGVDAHQPRTLPSSKHCQFYLMKTDEFFLQVAIGMIEIPPLDLVFIDADHTYEESKKDFDNVFPHVVDNGLIFLHDSYPIEDKHLSPSVCGKVCLTVVDIKLGHFHNCEVLTLPVFPGMTIVRKNPGLSKKLNPYS